MAGATMRGYTNSRDPTRFGHIDRQALALRANTPRHHITRPIIQPVVQRLRAKPYIETLFSKALEADTGDIRSLVIIKC